VNFYRRRGYQSAIDAAQLKQPSDMNEDIYPARAKKFLELMIVD